MVAIAIPSNMQPSRDTRARRGCSGSAVGDGSSLVALPHPQPLLGTSLFVVFDANSEMAQDAET